MKGPALTVSLMLAAIACLLIQHIWFQWLPVELLAKVIVTLVLLILAIGVIALIRRDYNQEADMKKKGYID